MSGPHAQFSTGAGSVRRYARGFSPIVGCENPQRPDFATLEKYCDPGESFYIDIWSGAPPDGWRIDKEARMFKMVWEAPGTCRRCGARTPCCCGPSTTNRPWRSRVSRTPALSESARRSWANISATSTTTGSLQWLASGSVRVTCTRSAASARIRIIRGHGLARKLTLKLVRRQMQRGKTTFLHVMSHNTTARGLYEKLGFGNYLETVVRVVTRVI